MDLLDSSYILKIGGFSSNASGAVTPAIKQEIISKGVIIPDNIGEVWGPTIRDFSQEDSNLYVYKSPDNSLIQLVMDKGHQKACCNKHEYQFWLSITRVDGSWKLCEEIVMAPDLSFITALFNNKTYNIKTYDECLSRTFKAIQSDLNTL